jgi:hypothetical protein
MPHDSCGMFGVSGGGMFGFGMPCLNEASVSLLPAKCVQATQPVQVAAAASLACRLVVARLQQLHT